MIPDLRQLVAETPTADLPALGGLLREAELLVEMRLRGVTPIDETADAGADRNLSAKETARRLGVSLPYLYKHAGEYPFTRYIGKRVLFSCQGLDAWSRGQCPRSPAGSLEG